MKTYMNYKKWWIENIAPRNIPTLYYGNTVESAFEAYVKGLGLYNLMETLADWQYAEDLKGGSE